MQAKNYQTLSEATTDLRKNGYTTDFMMENGRLKDRDTQKSYQASDLKIAEMYRFEGMTNPADESIVFAVTAGDGCKGIVTASYGTYADGDLLQFMDDIERMEGFTGH